MPIVYMHIHSLIRQQRTPRLGLPKNRSLNQTPPPSNALSGNQMKSSEPSKMDRLVSTLAGMKEGATPAHESWFLMKEMIEDRSGDSDKNKKKTLADWLDAGLGKTLRGCMIQELNDDAPGSSYKMNVYVKTVDRLLKRHRRNRKSRKDVEAELRTVDRLASAIIREICSLFLDYYFSGKTPSGSFRNVFRRLFEAASKRTLMKVSSNRFWELIWWGFNGDCKKSRALAAYPIAALLEKIPARFIEGIVEGPNNYGLLRMKCFVHSDENADKALLERLTRAYRRLGLDEQLARFHPHWRELSNACDDLSFDGAVADEADDSSFESPVVRLAGLVRSDEVDSYEAMLVGLPGRLANFLYSRERKEILDGNVRRFLSAFLRVGDDGRVESAEAFERLALRVIDCAARAQEELNQWRNGECLCRCTRKCSAVMRKKRRVLDSMGFLNYLCHLNENWYQWLGAAEGPMLFDRGLFLREAFVNVTSKLFSADDAERVQWASAMAVACPLAFPLDARKKLFFKPLWRGIRNDLHPFVVSRDSLLEDAEAIFEGKASLMDFSWNYAFKGELGRGPGPTKEFYSALSLEFQRQKYDLWEGDAGCLSDGNDKLESGIISSPFGLFPKLRSTSESGRLFTLLGKTMAKALLDGHQLDIPLSTEFFRKFICKANDLDRRSYYDITKALPIATVFVRQLISVINRKKAIESDRGLTESEKEASIRGLTFDDGSSFDDLYVDFTVPGRPDLALMENGEDVLLSPENAELYLERLNELVQASADVKAEAVGRGFVEVTFCTAPMMFAADELPGVFCGESSYGFTPTELTDHCLVEGGFEDEFRAVRFLFEVLLSLDGPERRLFLKFVTGRSRLPVGGLESLEPRMSLAPARAEPGRADERLPTASTCHNRLYLPDYSSLEVTREKLLYAISECRDSFQLV